MELGFVPDLAEAKLFNGVLEETEPAWDRRDDPMDEALCGLLDLDTNFSADDFMSQLPDDLELPMLQDGDILSTALEGIPLDDAQSSDGSDSGIDSGFHGYLLKQEPLSPSSSHCSELSQDYLLGADSLSSATCDGITVIKHEIPDILNSPGGLNTVLRPVHTNSIFSNTNYGSHNSGVSVVKMEAPLTPPVTPTTKVGMVSSTTVAPSSANGGPVPMKMVTVPGEGGTVVKMLVPAQSQIKPETVGTIRPGITRLNGGIVKPVPSIQPKSGASGGTAPTSGASKTLVLTTEEFAKLTSQKLINLKNGTSLQPIITSGGATSAPYQVKTSPVVTSMIKPSMTCLPQTDTDIKCVKRQQRMMKNRESACLSRKRKKEYMTTLEEQLAEYSSENNKLKNENHTLKKTIDVLKNENEKLRKILPSSAYKQTTVLLGVLLMLSLNLGPMMSILGGRSPTDAMNQQAQAEISQGSVHHGRTLMSLDYDFSQSDGKDMIENLKMLDEDWTKLKHTLHLQREDAASPRSGTSEWSSKNTGLMLTKGLDALTRPAICPTYFNSTESQRLLNDLRGWVKGHEEQLKREQEVKNQDALDEKLRYKKKKARPSKKKYFSPQKLKGSLATDPGLVNMDYTSRDAQGNAFEVQMFTGAEQQYQNFMKSLQRRNDTFYVVSFRRDHMLLPATAHNKTMRPRMSVVMPAMGLNETMATPDGSISMMQIDCEVTATRLVHIQKSVVPEHLDPNVTRPHAAPASRDPLEEAYWKQDQDDIGSLH